MIRCWPRWKRLDVNKDISPESVTIYEAATDASPDKTLVRKGMTTAALVGLVAGVIMLLLLDRLDDRVNTLHGIGGVV